MLKQVFLKYFQRIIIFPLIILYIIIEIFRASHNLLLRLVRFDIKCSIYDDDEITVYQGGINWYYSALAMVVILLYLILYFLDKLKNQTDSSSYQIYFMYFILLTLLCIVYIHKYQIISLRGEKKYLTFFAITGNEKYLGLKENSPIKINIGELDITREISFDTLRLFSRPYMHGLFSPSILYLMNKDIELKIGRKTCNVKFHSRCPNNKYIPLSTLHVIIHVKDLSILQPVEDMPELEPTINFGGC